MIQFDTNVHLWMLSEQINGFMRFQYFINKPTPKQIRQTRKLWRET